MKRPVLGTAFGCLMSVAIARDLLSGSHVRLDDYLVTALRKLIASRYPTTAGFSALRMPAAAWKSTSRAARRAATSASTPHFSMFQSSSTCAAAPRGQGLWQNRAGGHARSLRRE